MKLGALVGSKCQWDNVGRLRGALRQAFFPNRLLAGFPWLCAAL